MNTTIENNKLIAEFMGVFQDKHGFWGFEDTREYKRWHSDRFLDFTHYHIDWNWLMKVVEKIDNLKTPITNNHFLIGKFEDYEVHIQGKCIVIYAHGEVTKEVVHLRGSESNTSIEAVYKACLEFIKWYNENK